MYLISFAVALGASALLTPVARWVAFRFGIVSTPGGRHIHARVIPRLGGLGIFAAVVVTALVIFLQGFHTASLDASDRLRGVGALVGGTLMFIVGALDDVRGVRALYKLFVQIAAAVIAWGFGFRIDVVDLPLIGTFSMGVFSLPVTVIWITGIINAVNLIDGLDGLAAGVVFFAGVTNFLVAYMMGTTLTALIMATLAGAVLGFLFYNFNPARIFMGDSGSYFLGFILAACSISGPLQKASAAVSILVPVAALGVPIIDTLLAIVRRFLEKRPLFSPDRGHIHHRLLDMGITHRRAVLIIYGVTVALCVGSIGMALGRSWQVGVAVLGVSALLFGLVRFIGYFEYLAVLTRQKQRIRSRHVEWLRKCILRLPAELERVTTEEQALRTLRWVAINARLDRVEMELSCGSPHRPSGELSWRGDDYQDVDARDNSVAEFPLGNGHTVRFQWRSEYGEVSPQMEILLQLVVDELERGLVRVESALVVAEEAPSASAEKATAVTPAHALPAHR